MDSKQRLLGLGSRIPLVMLCAVAPHLGNERRVQGPVWNAWIGEVLTVWRRVAEALFLIHHGYLSATCAIAGLYGAGVPSP